MTPLMSKNGKIVTKNTPVPSFVTTRCRTAVLCTLKSPVRSVDLYAHAGFIDNSDLEKVSGPTGYKMNVMEPVSLRASG